MSLAAALLYQQKQLAGYGSDYLGKLEQKPQFPPTAI
jgi:hypothetical protein